QGPCGTRRESQLRPARPLPSGRHFSLNRVVAPRIWREPSMAAACGFLNQEDYAELIRVPWWKLAVWERGVQQPDGTATVQEAFAACGFWRSALVGSVGYA